MSEPKGQRSPLRDDARDEEPDTGPADARDEPRAGEHADELANELDRPIRRERERRARAEGARKVSIGSYLTTAGAIGWLVICPTVLGALAGRWLDRRFGTGILFSGALLMAGLALGCGLAWSILQRQGKEL